MMIDMKLWEDDELFKSIISENSDTYNRKGKLRTKTNTL